MDAPATAQPNPLTPQTPFDYDKEVAGAQDEYATSMEALTKLMPNIDYDQIFGQYLKKQQDAKPTTPMPGRMESFARAFGGNSDSVLGQIQQSRSESDKNSDEAMQTEREILKAKAAQELAKGNASQALKTHQLQTTLDLKIENAQHKRDAADKAQAEADKQTNRMALLDKKLGAAKTMLKDKIAAQVKAAGGDDKLVMKILSLYAEPEMARLKAQYNQDPMLGSALTNDEESALGAHVQEQIPGWIEAAQKTAEKLKTKPVIAPGSSTKEKPKSRLLQVAERKMAEQAKGK